MLSGKESLEEKDIVSRSIKLKKEYYLNDDVVELSRSLLGKILFSNIDGKLTAGKIIETEAYNGREDRACHAFLKRTKRTEVMYKAGGFAYVYLCYGIHHLFNIVTNKEGYADAILIRAVEPLIGWDIMRERRGNVNDLKLTAGPGTLSQAMGIKKKFSGTSLLEDDLWISHHPEIRVNEIEIDRRVGVDYAGGDALLPWRFFEKDNPWVSKKKQKNVDSNKFKD